MSPYKFNNKKSKHVKISRQIFRTQTHFIAVFIWNSLVHNGQLRRGSFSGLSSQDSGKLNGTEAAQGPECREPSGAGWNQTSNTQFMAP